MRQLLQVKLALHLLTMTTTGAADRPQGLNLMIDVNGLVKGKGGEVIGIIQSADGSTLGDLNTKKSPKCSLLANVLRYAIRAIEKWLRSQAAIKLKREDERGFS